MALICSRCWHGCEMLRCGLENLYIVSGVSIFFVMDSTRVLRGYGAFRNHATNIASKFHGNVQLILPSTQYFCANSANQPFLHTHCKPAKPAQKSIYPARWHRRRHDDNEEDTSSAHQHAIVLAPAHEKKITKCCAAWRSSRRAISSMYASCAMLALRRRIPLSF